MKNLFLFLVSVGFVFAAHSVSAADWSALSTGDVQSLRTMVQSGNHLVVAGNGGAILYSVDDGKTWVKSFSAPNVTFFDFATLPDGRLLAIGSNGIHEASSDNGLTWSPFSFGITQNIYNIDMKKTTSSNTGYLVGASGMFYHYANASGNWESVSLGITTDLYGTEDRGDGTGWIVGADGVIYKILSSGTSRAEIESGTNETLRSIRFISATHGFIVGSMGTILKTTDGGATWSAVSLPGLSTQLLYSIDVFENRVVIAGDKVLIDSSDAGATWHVKTYEASTKSFFGAFAKDATHAYAVGSDYDVTSLIYQLAEPTVAPLPPPVITPPVTGTAPQSSLIKLACGLNAGVNDPCKAVYYYATDGKRHAFTNDKVFFTWFSDFSSVKEVSAEFMASLTLGKNVTYRPGVKMVKFQTSPQVYAVAKGGVLRPILSESIASALYGTDWNKKIDDISDVFYGNYTFGEPVVYAADYDPFQERTMIATISDNF
ncbi:hypothetical protein A2318_03530 [Candidatus Uhrbacteria bacterium RIFOXYB2_FULL_45_11]|uniref:Photosynthesis system II assembly factor Ycf48/Hcf136-like domain-containing protein n=1 Tax=Candidatus Uhrbacteria bacterium RIFOXYB2_FULL_45_11 TaxID=1802421 RepID=A0A1F7W484_9BACT|nr:MAG: hypothetical protein A2318_03530 [Candidatus Uhrbacteria bacterium RIFOXYB2_FULL_45_11]